MTHDKLPRPAEDIRNEIKRMIPETASSRQSPESQARVLEVDEHGTKTYGGELLMDKISLMKDEMKISGVIGLIKIDQRWGYRLVHFPKPTKLNNEEQKQGYVIPLNNLTLTPGGVLEEGCYTYITDDPMVSPGATAVFILPY
ncbi:hypothetical protein N7489_004613 [Penicillium chrysogenum]|uniref:uncharacterized protein n=1 Tax=Penicillium chrysogenum TaxID=5076 RepID=UPI0024DF170B|nr:uncharacterized protein N7489_004613 [Penicillium chrysogenum]KAJ5244517.1 hypothetical protein N7489_004613 [Penicillium chrysogenum]KAJ5852978.1 hypothetical protein N7534_005521 [Penicillium rubens]